MTTLTRKRKPPIFFHFRLEELPNPFEGLNSSLLQLAKEPCCWFYVDFQVRIYHTLAVHVSNVLWKWMMLSIHLWYNSPLFIVESSQLTSCFLNTFTAGVQNICTLKPHMSCYFHVTLQLRNSPANCARELFKPWKYVASLLVCIFLNWKVLDFSFFVSDVISGVGLRPFWPRLSGPEHQPLEGIFWL